MENQTRFDLNQQVVPLAPPVVWQRRMYWMAIGMFVVLFWGLVATSVTKLAFGFGLFEGVGFSDGVSHVSFLYIRSFLIYGGIPIIAYGIIRGKFARASNWMAANHAMLAWGLAAVLSLRMAFLYVAPPPSDGRIIQVFSLGGSVGWPLFLAIMMARWNRFPKAPLVPGKELPIFELSGHQTPFNLTEALARWRDSLLAHESLSADAVRELETHMVEAIRQLRSQGLTEAEAFQTAIKRLGNGFEVADQFTQDDPTMIWKNRVFWMGVGWMFFYLVERLIPAACWPILKFAAQMFDDHSVRAGLSCLYPVLQMGCLLLMHACLVDRKYPRLARWVARHYSHFGLYAIGMAALWTTWLFIMLLWHPPAFNLPWTIWQARLYLAHGLILGLWPLSLAVLLVRHASSRKNKSRRTVES